MLVNGSLLEETDLISKVPTSQEISCLEMLSLSSQSIWELPLHATLLIE